MNPCIKQAPVLSKRFWIIPWPLAYHRLDCIRKILNFWYTFGWKWWFISLCDYLGLTNACLYEVDDVIGLADRFGFQNFCSPAPIFWSTATEYFSVEIVVLLARIKILSVNFCTYQNWIMTCFLKCLIQRTVLNNFKFWQWNYATKIT